MRPGDVSIAFARAAAAAISLGFLAPLRADTPPALASPDRDAAAAPSPASRPASAARLPFRFTPPASTPASPSGDTTPAPTAPAAPADLEVAPGVVRLPDFHVLDRRIDLEEREVLSAKGLVEAAKHRYLSPTYQKTFGPLSELALLYFDPLALLGGWHPNDAEAMALYEQDERLRRMHRTDDLLDLYRIDDTAEVRELQQKLYDTYRHDQPPPTRGHHDQ